MNGFLLGGSPILSWIGMKYSRKISVVIPEYKGASIMGALLQRLDAALCTISDNYEIILVNDCSPDDTWSEIKRFAAQDKRIIGLNLSRNYGEHYAISAGLKYAKGEWVVVMDCDLQNRPEDIPALYQKAQEGWDIVHARRVHKQFGFWKRLSSKVFHRLYDQMSGRKSDETIAEFGIYSAKVIAEYNKLKEVSRSFNFLIDFLGFRVTAIDVQHDPRADEEGSSYTLGKLLTLAFHSIIADSNKPLYISVALGFGITVISFLLAIFNVVAYFFDSTVVPGYTTTIFSIWFATGILLLMMGIIGLYIGKIFDQVKQRPIFIVMETVNTEEEENE